MTDSLHATRENVADHLDRILDNFKPGALICVTVRRPGYPEQDFVLTSDAPSEVIELLKRRMKAGPADDR